MDRPRRDSHCAFRRIGAIAVELANACSDTAEEAESTVSTYQRRRTRFHAELFTLP